MPRKRDLQKRYTPRLEYEEDGSPSGLPPSVRVGVWDAMVTMAANTDAVVRALVDRALGCEETVLCEQCQHPNKVILPGETRAMEIFLRYAKEFTAIAQKRSPAGQKLGDLQSLAEKMDDRTLAELVRMMERLKG